MGYRHAVSRGGGSDPPAGEDADGGDGDVGEEVGPMGHEERVHGGKGVVVAVVAPGPSLE